MKQCIKTLILLFRAFYVRDYRPKVVFYHDIGKKWTSMGTDETVFWKHIAYLREDDVICFDDGFRGIWDKREKLAELINRKNKIIVFLAVGLIGKYGYLTWDEISELQDEYCIDFQCHTWSHQTLAGAYNEEVPEPMGGRTENWFRHELIDSKFEIEQRLGKTVTSLCLPVGHFSKDVIRRCKEAGYKKVYASYPGNITEDYIQPRCLVQDLSVTAFRAILNGGMMAFEKRYRRMHVFS